MPQDVAVPTIDIIVSIMQENSILIYGARKSGTTLLQRLIDGSDVYVYPTELKLKRFSKATWSNKEAFIECCHRANRILRQDLDRFDNARFAAEIGQRLPKASCLRDMVLTETETAINCSPKGEWIGWAVKEVGGDFNVILNDWKKMFPDSRLVIIVRNPFYVSSSVFRDRRRGNRRTDLRAIVRQIVSPWQVIKAIRPHMNRKDVHLVYYEDIVSDTDTTMRAIAQFLGIKFVPTLTYPTLFGRRTKVSTASRDTESVFREQKGYWTELALGEAVLLSLIGGILLLRDLLQRKVKFENGIMRLISE